jgi:hypothetical protein
MNELAQVWEISGSLATMGSLAIPELTEMSPGANRHSWTEMFVSTLRTLRNSLTLPLQLSESDTVDTRNLNFADVISLLRRL